MTQPAVAAVETAVEPFDARPHWGKVFRADPARHHPLLAAFGQLAQVHDPNRRFANAFPETDVYG